MYEMYPKKKTNIKHATHKQQQQQSQANNAERKYDMIFKEFC